MKYRTLGKTGLQISEVGFGAWAIGGTSYGPTRDEDSLKALETAWDSGVNFFDTADTYGHGHSESLIAKLLKSKSREKAVIASKAGWDFYHGGSRKNFERDYLIFACEESLKRLQTDVIDLYQLHNPTLEQIQSGGPVDVLETLKRAGKIRFIGISVHTEADALAALEDSRVDAIQLVFNLIDQRMAEKVFPAALEKKIGIIVREPLAFGMLSGKYQANHQFHKTDHRNRFKPEKFALDLKKLEFLKAILPTQRLSLVRAALEYVLDFPEVSSVIPGMKTKEQVLENVQSSTNAQLRAQESYGLREIYRREPVFKEF